MTSRISFSKLMKENMCHRLAVNVVTLIYFLFTLLCFVIEVQNAVISDENVYKTILYAAGPTGLLTVCAVLGAVTAFCEFAYLHSKTKTDFYHSLPVRRKDIFWSVTANSFLIFAVLLAADFVIKAVITLVLGYFTLEVFSYLLLAILCSMLAFGAAFFTAALAMIMTGHIVVGILGTAVFITWAPLIIKYMFIDLQRNFFMAYVEPSKIFQIFDYGSPVYLAVCLLPLEEGWQWTQKALLMLTICVWIVILAVLCQYLFERRPSETAGKSMAFSKINPIIRVLLVIPAAVYTGSYLYSMTLSSSSIWIFIGVVIGTVLFHGIIECIYQFDIRGMWSNKKQMLLTLAAVFCLTVSFYLDLYGYDRFVPAAGGVESVMLEDNVASVREGYFWGEKQKEITGKEKEEILSLLNTAVQKKHRSAAIAENERDGYTGFYYSATGRRLSEEGSKGIQAVYHMRNGSEIKRNFELPEDIADEIMDRAYSMEDFRKSVYSLYTADWNQITDISYNNMLEEQTLHLTEDAQKEFLATYLDELGSLTYEEMRTIMPVAELCINHKIEKDGSSFEDFYYIYPSFTKTLAFYNSKGYDINKTLADVNISDVKITYYEDDGETTWTVSDPAVIQSVKDKLILNGTNFAFNVTGYEGENPVSGYDVTVCFNDGYGEKSVYVWTDAETLKTLTGGEAGE